MGQKDVCFCLVLCSSPLGGQKHRGQNGVGAQIGPHPHSGVLVGLCSAFYLVKAQK